MRGDRQAVRRAAAGMPAEMRALRARAMLEAECETLGVADVTCPGCEGDGWLERRSFEFCPVC